MSQDSELFWFGCVLGVGVVLAVLGIAGSEMDTQETESLSHDQLLCDRMTSLGISSWEVLRKKSGLTRWRLRQVREGKLGQLKLEEVQRLAKVLEWTQGELLQVFGISTPSPATNSSAKVEELQQQCQRLRQELGQQEEQLAQDFREYTFGELQTLLTNYPTAGKMAQAKPDLPAKNFSTLFSSLESLMQHWGCEPIGNAWEQVSFNPQLHQPDADNLEEGELVYIRFIGYRQGEKILCPAKVSRTLPAGAATSNS